MFLGTSCAILQPATLGWFFLGLAAVILVIVFVSGKIKYEVNVLPYLFAVAIIPTVFLPFRPLGQTFGFFIALGTFLSLALVALVVLFYPTIRDSERLPVIGLILLLVNIAAVLMLLAVSVSPACFFSGA